MATHVFIVNEQTFKHHLEYMFAGTGNSNVPMFLNNPTHISEGEKAHIGMIADISRVRVGDEIIFYLTGCKEFYGFFRVVSRPFADVNCNYLGGGQIGKDLYFRVLLEPTTEVYAKGITEWECFESISGVEHPYQMCWSLIYRKLIGLRGCAALFDYEAERIKRLIRAKNNNTTLQGTSFSYDNTANVMIVTKSRTHIVASVNLWM